MPHERSAPPVSVITTLFNEQPHVDAFVTSLLQQTRPADEIVVLDGGSTDGTLEALRDLARAHPSLRVLAEPTGRSAGRNRAIEAATHDVIACIDGGCEAEPTWLANLTAPFDDPDTTWVAGFYRPEHERAPVEAAGLVMVYVLDEVDPASFLPSARSMGLRRSAWREVGGFPEHLQFAEDTLFDQRLLDAGHRPVFVGDAVVRWRPPGGFVALARTLFRWGRGDGQAGLRGSTYRRLLLGLATVAVLTLVAASFDPRLAVVGPSLLVAEAAHRSRRKLRWATRPSVAVLVPIAQVVHTVALTAGFAVGRWGPRS